jgi:hypothetical protein
MREISPRFHNHDALWSDEENEILIRMWKNGHYTREICDALNKSKGCIVTYIARNRAWLGLEKRPTNYRKKGHTYNLHGTAFMKAFDKEWHGPVPLKHWAITKRWGA